jgi:glycosyltransferase involved in cell wall biosynthesis
MDLCGEMLLDHLPRDGPCALEAAQLCPPFHRLATRLPGVGRGQAAFNADRLLNRFFHFPRHARRAVQGFDLFHVVDHTYAHVVHALPAGRAGVYCHDLDAFRCLLDPAADPRPLWYRVMAQRILGGLRKAAVVFYNTQTVGDEIRRAGWIDSGLLVHAPLGVAPQFVADGARATVKPPWLAELDGRPWALHVGNCIRRKRIDVLLEVIAAVRATIPDLRLVKVGGQWTSGHREQISRLGLDRAITHVTGLSRAELAEVYRRAHVVLMPSAAEGFGLPVIEALACGAAVVASDIPALREAGGPAVTFAPVGDVAAWSNRVAEFLASPAVAPSRADRLAWAGRFTWRAHADIIARAYHRLL